MLGVSRNRGVGCAWAWLSCSATTASGKCPQPLLHYWAKQKMSACSSPARGQQFPTHPGVIPVTDGTTVQAEWRTFPG